VTINCYWQSRYSKYTIPPLYYIYALQDPRDNLYYYIGKTKDPQQRLKAHIKSHSNKDKCAWIKEIVDLGLKPIMVILAQVNQEEVYDSEQAYIRHGLSNDWPLTNVIVRKYPKRQKSFISRKESKVFYFRQGVLKRYRNIL
jgi:hypothetical protein